MAIVVGKIESLKKLKEILHNNHITRFNSTGEIKAFIKNYESEKSQIPNLVKASLNEEIKSLEEALNNAIKQSDISLINKILYFLKIRSLTNKKASLENNYAHVVSNRCIKAYKELDLTKKMVDSLSSLIAGAIGEHLVAKEIKKLPDNYYLINDLSINFKPPIYNKKENDRILSIQVDHILICKAGVFLLETKKWSAHSINNINLRSPIKQILRTNFALFVLLNGSLNKSLTKHHWGNKKIPIRNILVMVGKKPKEEFNHVKVLSLNELNRYIQYFDDILNEDEVKKIFNYLYSKKQ